MDKIKAQMLLMKCKGDEIWSIETCRNEAVPEIWITELRDTFESGYDSDRQTIYVDEKMTNQYHGVSDLKLAYKLAEYLGVDWKTATQFAIGKRAEVKSLQGAFEEG